MGDAVARARRAAGRLRARLDALVSRVPVIRDRKPGPPDRAAETTIALANGLRSVGTTRLVGHALLTRSRIAREVLALRATRGRATWAALRRASSPDRLEPLLAGGSRRDLVDLLRVVEGAPADEIDRAVVGAVARRLADARRPWLPGSPQRRTLVEILLAHGERTRADRLLGTRVARGIGARLLFLDIDNPFRAVAVSPVTRDRWAREFAALFTRAGLEPVRVEEAAADVPPFDRLRSSAVTAIDDGPLVSIVMTSYRPGPDLLTAVDSIVAQSWQRWELLVIDDGSGAEADGILAEAQRRDPRVEVIRADDNRGTYVRRNEAIARARGEFVTMHDSDDWAHPRRLERQLAPLLADPSLVATLSQSVRVTELLEFVQPRGAQVRLTETSILFRRERALGLAGAFDSTRRAADSGFRLRLEAASGRPVPVVDEGTPLTVVRYRAASLSGAELGDGWMHPARLAYAGAHEHWMRQEAASGASLVLDFPMATRPFPAPPHVLGLPSARHELDVLFVVDVRAGLDDPVHARELDESLARWSAAGHRVGVLRADAAQHQGPSRLARDAVLQLVADERVVEVISGDAVGARVVVVADESSLLGGGAAPWPIVTPTIVVQRHPGPLGAAIDASRQELLEAVISSAAQATVVVADAGVLTAAIDDALSR